VKNTKKYNGKRKSRFVSLLKFTLALALTLELTLGEEKFRVLGLFSKNWTILHGAVDMLLNCEKKKHSALSYEWSEVKWNGWLFWNSYSWTPFIIFGYKSSWTVLYTVKTRASFRHSLRHRNSASASVFLREKTTLLSVKTTLRLSYQVLKMTLWVSFWYFWVKFNKGT
jgi:hypothetical protein